MLPCWESGEEDELDMAGQSSPRNARKAMKVRNRFSRALVILACLFAGPSIAIEVGQDFGGLQTEARFSADGNTHSTVSALAWRRVREYGGDEFRVYVIGFYPFPLSEQQFEAAKAGDYQPIEEQVTEDYYSADYSSSVKIIILVGEDDEVLQVDMSLPGYTCTIAPFEEEIEAFFQDFRLENDRLRLSSKGSIECLKGYTEPPHTLYEWKFDVDLPVYTLTD